MKSRAFKKSKSAINDLLRIVARLRAPGGCPWDREQDHKSIRFHAVEEIYELLDAIEADDDLEMAEELGDLLLQVVFHCQMAGERGAFDFETVARHIVDKLVRRHPHVFGDRNMKDAEAVLAQWERIKRAEKHGTRHERPSALDGIPKHLPALHRAEKLVKKACKAGLVNEPARPRSGAKLSKADVARELFCLAQYAREHGWSAEGLLRAEIKKREGLWRGKESADNSL